MERRVWSNAFKTAPNNAHLLIQKPQDMRSIHHFRQELSQYIRRIELSRDMHNLMNACRKHLFYHMVTDFQILLGRSRVWNRDAGNNLLVITKYLSWSVDQDTYHPKLVA